MAFLFRQTRIPRCFLAGAAMLLAFLYLCPAGPACQHCNKTPTACHFPLRTKEPAALQTVWAATKSPLSRNGRLKVSGAQLVNSRGKAVQLKGVSTHGLAWYPQYVDKETFRELRDKWKVDVIRLSMYTAEYNGYCTGSQQNKKDLEKTIDQAVTYCTSLGLYAIIDWHILSDSDPNTYRKEANSFFRKLAKKYAGHSNILYEICNEPNGSTGWAQVCSYAKTVIKTIRKEDKHAIIIIGTPSWCQDIGLAANAPIKGSNLMYAFHFYAATHTSRYRQKLQAAIDAGLPVFVTEYGICEASGSGAVNKAQANKWMKLLDKHNISCVAWNLSNKEEACALLKNSCTKVSGWKRSDLSVSGKWVYDMLQN